MVARRMITLIIVGARDDHFDHLFGLRGGVPAAKRSRCDAPDVALAAAATWSTPRPSRRAQCGCEGDGSTERGFPLAVREAFDADQRVQHSAARRPPTR